MVKKPEPAGELLGRSTPGEVEQRLRVAPRLDDDAVQHALVDRTGDHGSQQRPRVTLAESANQQLRQSLEIGALTVPAGTEDDRDRLGDEVADGERERLRRFAIEQV